MPRAEDEPPRRASRCRDRAAGGRGRVARRHRRLLPRQRLQSRVLEDTLVRYGVAYQVIGGTRFYERAEIKDAGLPDTAGEPLRHGRLRAGRQLSAPRHRPDVAGAPGGARQHHRLAGLGGGWQPGGCPGSAPGGQGGRALHVGHGPAARARRGRGGGRRPPARDPRGDRLHRGSRPSARSSRRCGWRTSRSWSAWRASTTRAPRAVGRVPPADRALLEQDNLRDELGLVTLMTLHNAKGLEFDTVSSSGWRTACSRIRARSRRATRGGAPPAYVGITRAKRELYLTYAHASAVRQPRLEPAQPLHRRDPDRVHRP